MIKTTAAVTAVAAAILYMYIRFELRRRRRQQSRHRKRGVVHPIRAAFLCSTNAHAHIHTHTHPIHIPFSLVQPDTHNVCMCVCALLLAELRAPAGHPLLRHITLGTLPPPCIRVYAFGRLT